MLTKAVYDRSVSETLSEKLDVISLRVDLDLATTPPMPPFPDQLSQRWEPKEPPYEEDDEEDDE